jgi:hypothetical protein
LPKVPLTRVQKFSCIQSIAFLLRFDPPATPACAHPKTTNNLNNLPVNSYFTPGGQSGPLGVGQRGAMCEKCIEIDKKIERYRRIQQSILDQVTVDRTKELVADLEAEKAALHPEQQE